jgi:biotin synthase-like enzyme
MIKCICYVESGKVDPICEYCNGHGQVFSTEYTKALLEALVSIVETVEKANAAVQALK